MTDEENPEVQAKLMFEGMTADARVATFDPENWGAVAEALSPEADTAKVVECLQSMCAAAASYARTCEAYKLASNRTPPE